MSPLVSVVIPAYRAGAFVGTAIESVLGQTLEDFELIVVDDASPDDTYAVAASYADPRLRVLRNDTNLGAEGNWNRAVSLATGRYLKLLCSDDLLYPRCLERQVEAFEQPGHERVVLVSCPRDVVDESGTVLLRARGLAGVEGLVDGPTVVRRTVRGGTNLIGEPSIALCRRDVLDRAGAFDGTASYVIDLDMWCRMLRHGDFYGIPEPLCAFRVRVGSWTAELSARQAAAVRALYRRLHHEHPELVDRRDVLVGSAKATLMGYLRRGAFWWARRRQARRRTQTAYDPAPSSDGTVARGEP